MSNVLSSAISRIAELLGDRTSETFTERMREADRLLTATIETISDTLAGASRSELAEWTTKAGDALRRLGEVDEASPTFMAGRLSAIVDLLGYATASTASEEILDVLSHQPHRRILATVADGNILEADIAAAAKCDEDVLQDCLAELQSQSLIVRYSHGSSKVVSLTPLGKLVMESALEHLLGDDKSVGQA